MKKIITLALLTLLAFNTTAMAASAAARRGSGGHSGYRAQSGVHYNYRSPVVRVNYNYGYSTPRGYTYVNYYEPNYYEPEVVYVQSPVVAPVMVQPMPVVMQPAPVVVQPVPVSHTTVIERNTGAGVFGALLGAAALTVGIVALTK